MPENQIRTTTLADLDALDRLYAESYPVLLKPDYPASVLTKSLPLISHAQPRLLSSGSYYLIEEEGLPLAAGGWTAESPLDREACGIGHIRHLVTHPKATRRGLASALLDRCFDRARAAGLSGLVATSTRTAVPFYRAKGCVPECEIIVPLRQGVDFPAVRMTCSL